MDLPTVPSDAAPLPSGDALPLLGFGTWQLTGAAAQEAVETALAAGYRHVDTATIYGNEREVGAGLRAAGGEGVFVTTKLPPDRADRARETLEESLQLLGVDQVDLWLIHWPPDGSAVALWETFLALREEGLTREVGVSNFGLDTLDQLRAATGVVPAVNQIRYGPYEHRAELLDGHRERGVVVEGYSGLKHGTLTDPVITGIADRLGRTPAQVITRWHLEHGIVTIPKSTRAERVRSNADVGGWALDPEDVAAIDALSRR